MSDGLEIFVDGTKSENFKVMTVAGYESISQPSLYETTLISTNPDEKPADILGKVVDIKCLFSDAAGENFQRSFCGVAVKMVRGYSYERFFEYKVTLRSWLWLLTKKTNSRIFQDKTVIQIVETILADKPISKYALFDSVDVKLKHPVRSYCVQYQETDFDFITRILASEGISFFFDCYSDAGRMIATDDHLASAQPLPATPTIIAMPTGSTNPEFNEVGSALVLNKIVSGAYVGQDVSYKNILKTRVHKTSIQEFIDGELEQYEFPYGGSMNEGKDGVEFELTDEEDKTLINARELEACDRSEQVWITSTWPDISPGQKVTYQGSKGDPLNTDFLTGISIFSVVQSIADVERPNGTNYVIGDSIVAAIQADPMLEQTSEDVLRILALSDFGSSSMDIGDQFFTALYAFADFKPLRPKQRGSMPGPQTALVVGSPGKEHDVDPMGRVKVKFFWDRDSDKKYDTTCWIRVSQPMAGKGWGGYFAPRVGQEVIVDFLNGDPDKPIIVGRVYNNDQPIPYPSATTSGFRTRSTPEGTPSNFNEIKFEDKKGAEELHMQAERNMSTTVKANQSTSTGSNQSFSVGHDQSTSINNDRTLNVANNDKNIVNNQQKNFAGSQVNAVKTIQTTFVGQVQATVVGSGQFLQVGASGQHEKISGDRHITANANDTLLVSGEHKIKVSGGSSTEAAKIMFRSKGKRTDASVGDHVILSDGSVKIIASSDVSLVASANVNTIAPSVNTTVLGKNSNGYMGQASDFALGTSANTFLGLRTEATVALSSSAFLGMQTELTVGPKFETSILAFSKAPLQLLDSGAGGDGPPAAPALQAIMAVAGAIAVVGGSAYSIGEGLESYTAAIKTIADARREADAAGLTALSARLGALHTIASDAGIVSSFTGADSVPNSLGDPSSDSARNMVVDDGDTDPGIYGPFANPTPAQESAMQAEAANSQARQLMRDGASSASSKPKSK